MNNEAILELYDTAEDKRKQIFSIAKMFRMPLEEVQEIIQNSGREIPLAKKRGPKPKGTNVPEQKEVPKMPEEPKEAAAHSKEVIDVINETFDLEKQLSEKNTKNEPENEAIEIILPDIVKNTLEKEMDELDGKIKVHQEAIDSYTRKYIALANFMKNPLGWKLSQNESHCDNASDFSGGRKEDHVKESI